MHSIIDGYEYDIFISYRQKDNRGDHWVTDFVNALKAELDATFKEDISIYFDQNPHDGLLETHLVDQSLEGKLKCLVFIPIISQTYCDTKSFAWKNEFCAFNTIAKNDRFGRDIKLESGNVGCRILPIKIKELDNDDKALLESELNGPLRSIEFIYKEPGVNRPLKPDDNESKNQNGTKYRNQINKVANSIKEIVSALKHHNDPPRQTTKKSHPVPSDKVNSKSRPIVLALFLLTVAVAAYVLFFNRPASITASQDKSIAVLPFADLSESRDQEWFSDGLTEELLNSLANLEELKVTARTSSFAFKGKNISVQKIADSLNVSYIVEGSVRKHNDQLRITAQLIKAADGSHLWSQTYDRPSADVFAIQHDISQSISAALEVYLDDRKRENMLNTGTRNVEAYEAYLKGNAVLERAHADRSLDMKEANVYFEQAVKLDPKFAAPYYGHHDLFAHFLMSQTPHDQSDTLTLEVAKRLMTSDFENAIKNARDEEEKLFYEMDLTYLSDNWRRFPALIRRLETSEQTLRAFSHRTGWLFSILLALNRQDLALKILSHHKELNPLDTRRSYYEIYAYSSLKQADTAMNLYKKIRLPEENNPWVLQVEADLLVAQGKYAEAYGLMKNQIPEHSPELLTLRAWAGEAKEVKKIAPTISFSKREFMTMAQLFAVLHDQKKADSLAHELDKEPSGPQLIFNQLFTRNMKICFNLSATPNLSARLREAGLDPVEYQRKNFTRLPASAH